MASNLSSSCTMSGYRADVDVGWARAVFKQLCGGASTLTVEPLSRAVRDLMPQDDSEYQDSQAFAIALLDSMDADRNGMD